MKVAHRNDRAQIKHVLAYDPLREDANVGARVRDILIAGVSTRRYSRRSCHDRVVCCLHDTMCSLDSSLGASWRRCSRRKLLH